MTPRTPQGAVRRTLASSPRQARTAASRRIVRSDAQNTALVRRQDESASRRRRVNLARGRMAAAKAPAAPPTGGGYVPEAYSPTLNDVVQCPVCKSMVAPDAAACDQCATVLAGRDDVATGKDAGQLAQQRRMISAHRRATR